MGKKLVIVESPAKAKTINKILGGDYIVKSSVGHIRDLPVKNLGVDIEHSFKPSYVLVKGKKQVVNELKKAAEGCDCIYLAPDPDREGEAIAWHLSEVLKGGKIPTDILRVQFNEITPRAVRNAFEHPGEIDLNRVDAQQARRVLDRIVGYKVSPMLWQRLRRGLSAGRVQSVALRLVCEREDEIQKFVPEAYWILGALVRKLVDPKHPFILKLARINGEKAEIKNIEFMSKIGSDLKGAGLQVKDISIREVKKRPSPPYITSTLQQAGSSYCSFSPKRTMSIAQKLYEGVDIGGEHVGLITYMRTDSFSVAQEALLSCREYIKGTYGEQYCPEKPNYYKSRSSAQEAHEAIRPTDVSRTPDSLASKLAPQELKLYKLIWRRFVASQMSEALIEQRTVKAVAVSDSGMDAEYLFQATSSDVKFAGYMKVADNEKTTGKDEEDNNNLPEVTVGENLECVEWQEERKETKPPPRYSEASLVRALEGNGVGRPSTYAQIISTLQQRKYVDIENRSLTPTVLGCQVSALLVSNLGDLFDVKFTALMEESLDKVEKGDLNWTAMLTEFYTQFEQWMQKAQLPPADTEMVSKTLAVLSKIKEWMPETKRGKRVYSDKKFVESIQKQIDDAKKPISQRQLTTLLKISCHYRSQVPEIEEMIRNEGLADMLTAPDLQPPQDATIKKLELLKRLKMDERAEAFIGSLRSQVEGGRCLSAAQIHALNNVVVSHSGAIEGYELLKDELMLENSDAANDHESGILLKAMESVSNWKPPVTRGKREFNDESFYKSLCQHFGSKGFLSIRQRAALKRLMSRYESEINNFDDLAEQFSITKKKSKAD